MLYLQVSTLDLWLFYTIWYCVSSFAFSLNITSTSLMFVFLSALRKNALLQPFFLFFWLKRGKLFEGLPGSCCDCGAGISHPAGDGSGWPGDICKMDLFPKLINPAKMFRLKDQAWPQYGSININIWPELAGTISPTQVSSMLHLMCLLVAFCHFWGLNSLYFDSSDLPVYFPVRSLRYNMVHIFFHQFSKQQL